MVVARMLMELMGPQTPEAVVVAADDLVVMEDPVSLLSDTLLDKYQKD